MFALCSGVAATDKLFVDCDGCSSTEMRAAAVAVAPTNSGYTDVYAYNFTGNSISKYSVLKETEPGHEWNHVITGDAEQDIQGDFDKAVFTIQTFEVPGTFRPISVTGYNRAFDAVNDSNAHRDLVNQMADHFGINWVGVWLSAVLMDLSAKLTNMKPVVHFVFPDGSLLIFEATDFDPTALSLTLVFVRGTDADGNAIHQTAGGYSGDSGTVDGAQSRDSHIQFISGLGLLAFIEEVNTCGSTLSCTWTCGPSSCTYICKRAC